MMNLLNRDKNPEELAQSMIRIYGRDAAGKAVDLIRLNTDVRNREAAVKWHRVMSLIEEYRRKSK